MIHLTQDDFEKLVAEALDSLPAEFEKAIKNVQVQIADQPSEEQSEKLHLGQSRTLFGLYEGIPLTQRGTGFLMPDYSFTLPDQITIFQGPIEQHFSTADEVRAAVRHTVLHEIAHFFGISDDRLHELGAY